MELMTIKNVRGYIDKDGTAFLNLEDVARGLGFEKKELKNGKEYKSIRWSRIYDYLKSEGFDQEWSKEEFIPENAFYSLCMIANSDIGKQFRRVVCDEILPAIRKNGGYIVTTDQDDEMTIMSKAILLADKTIKGLKNKIDTLESANNLLKRNKEALRIEKEILEADNEILTAETQIQQQRLSELEPIKEYVDVILASPDALAISQIAADYGMTGRELNDILHKKGVIRKIGGQWILYKKHMNKGYTQSKTYSYKTVFGLDKTNVSTYWTQKGRLKIHEILTAMGIKANCDKVQDN